MGSPWRSAIDKGYLVVLHGLPPGEQGKDRGPSVLPARRNSMWGDQWKTDAFAWPQVRGKYVTSGSSASAKRSMGTSYMRSVAMTGLGPVFPLTQTWAESTISPLIRERQPCRPIVAT